MKKLLLILGFSAIVVGVGSCGCANCINCDNASQYNSTDNVCKSTYEASGATSIMSWQSYSDALKSGGCVCN